MAGFEQDDLDNLQDEYEQTQRDLRELDMLIKQSASEVERLAQRNAEAKNRVRQLQGQIETTPRDYIKEVYEEVADAQQRLFAMRGQLEKLQSDQRNLERIASLQTQLLEYQESMGGATPTKTAQKRKEDIDPQDQSTVIRVIQTEETARQTLVRKMHDGPASSLSNFILQAEICQRLFDVDPDRARAELNALKSTASATFEYVKNFIFDLRPMMLDDLGAIPTLRRYVESLQEKSSIPMQMTVTGVDRRLESHIEVTIFRNVQILLNNAVTHAQPSQVQVSVDLAQDQVQAIVEDNGSGFNVDEVLQDRNISTIGLPTVRERVRMLGGEFNLQSTLGRGTRAEFTIPLSVS